jgi:bacterioferritin
MNVANKWGGSGEIDQSEAGKYNGWTLEDLRKKLKELKDSGPHKEGSPEFEQQNEIEFAIRAKTGWGKVTSSVNVSMGAPIVPNKETLLPLLNKAVASGYKASFQYMIASELVRGNEGSEIAEALDEHSKDDQEDVRAILKRIIEIEGQPIVEFDDISKVAPAFRPPKDISTIAIVKQTIDTEQDAIKLYTEILTIAKEANDFATVELFQNILKGEVEQERIFQNFLEDLTSKG